MPHQQNSFLAALSASDLDLLLPLLTKVTLWPGDQLQRFDRPVEYVIFPHSGLVALTLRNGNSPGPVLIGKGGIVAGLQAAATVAACDAVVRLAGEASRISATTYCQVLDERPAIRQLAACFDAALFAHALQTAFCNASHLVNARLARLLLEAQDHNGSLAEVRLTHADFAQILGVRRTTVTLVMGQLEAAGAIRCRRGFVEILERDLLKQHCCECFATPYGAVLKEFDLPR